jgi:opacity protein-like surface antigen
VGLVKSRLGSSGDLFNVDSTDWGFNVGAGAVFFFSDNVGVRGDVRYFRSLEDVEPIDDFNIGFANFRFWRGTLGVTIRF